MTRPIGHPLRTILLAVWLSILFWPYAHSGGFLHPTLLSAFPLVLALADIIPWWPLGIVVALAGILVEFVLELGGQLALLPLTHLPRTVGHLLHQNPALWLTMSPQLGLLFILAAVLLGWFVFRQAESRSRVLLLLVLGITILAVNHTFWHLQAETPAAAYLVIGLWLLAEAHLVDLASRWIGQPSWPWYGMAAAMIIVPLAVGWSVPGYPSHYVNGSGGSGPGGGGTVGAFGALGLSTSTTGLGIGDTLINHSVTPSTAPVMTITGAPQPAYWQVGVYDTFNGVQWTSSAGQIYPFRVGQFSHPLFPAATTGFSTSSWTVSFVAMSTPHARLLYTGTPTAVTSASSSSGGEVLANREELVGPRYYSYTVQMAVPNLNVSAIAGASFDPAVTNALGADLQLPGNLSPKVGALAQQITASANGPWQAAQDLKQYLDTHEKYSYKFRPSQSGNVVNSFLFRQHQGFCDQFSTTFIMMARTLGIPARWVVGYTPGIYEVRQQRYLVRAIDAHSWAEIYIAPYGWIPVDPTPGWALGSEWHTSTGGSTASTHPTAPLPATGPTHPASPKHSGHPASPGLLALHILLGLAAVALAVVAGWRLWAWRGTLRTRIPWRLRRLARGWRAVRWLSRPRGPTNTLRETWQALPDDIKPALVPVVQLLESSWYANRTPSVDSLDAADKATVSAIRTLLKRWRTSDEAPA